jgi:nucleolar pre-ribosomal-associated protein 1
MTNSMDGNHRVKRRKVDGERPVMNVKSASDLNRLFTFRQGSLVEAKTAVQQFKSFLEAISGSENEADRSQYLQALMTYSNDQISLNDQANPFPTLISTWALASENSDDSLLSLVPSVLALYLKSISRNLEFREIGLALCKGLLKKDELRLFHRGLTATKTKEHLISPCLRLLTEVVSFDGGACAELAYSRRDTTFRRLDLFLEQRDPARTEATEDAGRKPTLRRISQRYLLANLKFQGAKAKADIVAQGKILRACLHGLRNDGSDIICDVVNILEKYVVKDSSLSRRAKTRLFNSSNLSSLASLYTIHEPEKDKPSRRNVRETVDTLLRLICTQQENGVLVAQTGWYPVGDILPNKFTPTADQDAISLDIEPLPNSEGKRMVSVKNSTLSAFIQALRPEVDNLQASLLLDIFRKAPELVADYFSQKRNFMSEPKDSPAWLGQSAFLFSAIQLPIPIYLGLSDSYAATPPPMFVAIENIVPCVLDRAYLTKCLNLNHDIITMFGARVVTVAFQKLGKVLEIYQIAAADSESWRRAASNLILEFSQRCPLIKDVLSTLQRTPKSDTQLRNALIELLANYYKAVPHLALLEKFDASLALVEAIGLATDENQGQSTQLIRFAQFENLLQIARVSPDTKWWQKPGRSTLSKPLAC